MKDQNENNNNNLPEEPELQAAGQEDAAPEELDAALDEILGGDEEADSAELAEQPEKSEKDHKKKKPGKEKPKKQRRSVAEIVGTRQFRHGMLSKGITAGFIVIIILLNVVVSILGSRFPSINFDLTSNKTNTLSKEAVEIAKSVSDPTTVYILASEENAKGNPTYKPVTVLAAKMAEQNGSIKVEYVDLEKNPKFAAEYTNENLNAYDVLVKTEKRHRLISSNDLFPSEINYQTYQQTQYNNVDSALANGLAAVNAETVPVVAVDTSHMGGSSSQYGQQVTQIVNEYRTLLESSSFEVKDFSLMTDEIPENTQLILLPAPATDYTDGEITKLNAFLKDDQLKADRSVLAALAPGAGEMKTLNAFLNEWGIAPKDTMVAANDAGSYYSSNEYLAAKVQTGVDLGGTGTYEPFVMAQSIPVEILFDSRNGITVNSLIKSPGNCSLYDLTTNKDTGESGTYDLAAMAQTEVDAGESSYKAGVAVFGSFVSMSFANQNTFGVGRYLSDFAHFATGTDASVAVVDNNYKQEIVQDITANSFTLRCLSFVFAIFIPLLVLGAGIAVFLKRRHL